MPLNSVTIIGNLASDPDLRFTSNGQPVAKFAVAYAERYRDASSGQWQEGEVSYFTVIAWGDLGEHVAESFQRGQRVMVSGQMRQRSWDTPDGKRYAVEIRADDVGASVRFATVKIQKAARPQPSGSDDPWAAEPATGAQESPDTEPGSQPAPDGPESPAAALAGAVPDDGPGGGNGIAGTRSRSRHRAARK